MDNTYYFPSAQVLFVDTANKTVITTNAPQFVANVTQFQAVGFHEVLIGSVSYLVVSIGISSTYVLGEVMAVTNATDDTFRCIVMVSVDEAQSPSINIDLFMQLQTTTLDAIIFGWSFVILLSNIGLATVVGNYVFSNLRTLSTKLKLYIKEPSKFHQISIELKEL